MTKNNFYVITGGPGGGKTSLLEKLALMGYRYIPETARQIIRERLSMGLTPRPDPVTFGNTIFAKDFSNYEININYTSPLFFDRSFMDSAWQLFESDQGAYNEIKNVVLNYRYNTKAFITPPWKEIYKTDTERDQTFADAIEVYERLEQWYKDHGYAVIALPKDSVNNRVKFILSQISN